MNNNDTNLNVNIKATDSSKAAVKDATGNFNGLWKEVAAGQLAAQAAQKGFDMIVGGVTMAIKGAADFQQQLTKLVTSAGESQANLGLVSEGIKAISISTGGTLTDLADGMYKVESAGFHGQAGLDVLKAAEQGAKAEGSDLVTVADAMSSAMVDYGYKTDQAATVTSKMVAATSAGKMTFQQLAGALPQVLPAAAAAKESFNDILGSLASMTVHGMSADQAAQDLSHTIGKMQNPLRQQAQELSLLGMTTNQLADDMKSKGLSGTLQEISDKIRAMVPPGQDKVILDMKTALNGLSPAVRELGMHLFDGTMSAKDYAKAAVALDPISAKQATAFATLAGATHRIGDQQLSGAQVMQNYSAALYKATGDATTLKTALMLTGDNANTTTDAIKTISGATAEAGNNVKGWAEIQSNFNTKLDQFKAMINVAAVSLGQALLPILTNVVNGVIGFFTYLNEHHHVLDLFIGGVVGLAAVLSGMLVSALWSSVAAFAALAVAAAPWILLGTVIGVAIAGAAILIKKEWGKIMEVLKPVINFFEINILPIVKDLAHFVGNQLKQAWDDVTSALKSLWTTLKPFEPQLKILAVLIGIALLTPILLTIAGIIAFITVVTGVITIIARVIGWIAQLVAWFVNLYVNVQVSMAIFQKEIYNGIAVAIRWFKDLPGKMVDALGDMGSYLYNAGRDMINGFIKGAESMIGQIGHSIGNIANDAVNTMKSLLGIHSPSTVFAEIGQNMGQGLINGVNGIKAQANVAVTGLVTANPLVNSTGGISNTSNVSHYNTSQSYGGNTQTVNIGQVVLPPGSTARSFFGDLNQDTMNLGKGLSPVGGLY